MTRFALMALLALTAAPGCYKERPPRPASSAPLTEDDFAARAAALQKVCELAVIYVGVDDARALALVKQGREDALVASRGASDAGRAAVFVRCYRRLENAAVFLEGVGQYAPPPSAAACDRIRDELRLAADELKPIAEPYYAKLTARYAGPPSRPRRWGPLSAAETEARRVTPARERRPAPPGGGEAAVPTAAPAPPSGPIPP